MKWRSLLVLLAIVLGIVLPPSLPFMSDHGAAAAIGTLDVCHSATPALSSGGEMPCMISCTCQVLLPAVYISPERESSPTKPLVFTIQEERPPKH